MHLNSSALRNNLFFIFFFQLGISRESATVVQAVILNSNHMIYQALPYLTCHGRGNNKFECCPSTRF